MLRQASAPGISKGAAAMHALHWSNLETYPYMYVDVTQREAGIDLGIKLQVEQCKLETIDFNEQMGAELDSKSKSFHHYFTLQSFD